MQRMAIATQIYSSLIGRSPRDFSAAIQSPMQKEAIEALANAALGLADVLIAADAKSRPAAIPMLAVR